SLSQLLYALAPQIAKLIVVDNTPDDRSQIKKIMPTDLDVVQLRPGGNKGVAEGLNMGIRYAIAHGCSHVLLSDQDSTPSDDMVDRLLRAERQLLGAGLPVAAVGPNVINEVVGSKLNFQLKAKSRWTLLRARRPVTESEPFTQVTHLIPSGTLVS